MPLHSGRGIQAHVKRRDRNTLVGATAHGLSLNELETMEGNFHPHRDFSPWSHDEVSTAFDGVKTGNFLAHTV